MIKFWSYNKEYRKYRKQILSNINKTILKGNIFFGSQLEDFEKFMLNFEPVLFLILSPNLTALSISSDLEQTLTKPIPKSLFGYSLMSCLQ